jgi:hypothetical protein
MFSLGIVYKYDRKDAAVSVLKPVVVIRIFVVGLSLRIDRFTSPSCLTLPDKQRCSRGT